MRVPIFYYFFYFLFWAEAPLTKIPTPTQGKEFCHGTICKLGKRSDRRWRLIRCYILAISAPKQVEWFYRATRYILHKNFVISIFVVQCGRVLLGTTRYWSCKPSEMPLKKWRREKLFDSQDIIAELKWTYLCCFMLKEFEVSNWSDFINFKYHGTVWSRIRLLVWFWIFWPIWINFLTSA